MILFENGIIKLNYDPATDIMDVRFADLQRYLITEIQHSLDILVEHIRNHDVKKLLFDASNSQITTSGEKTKDKSLRLAQKLMQTRLQKVARIGAHDQEREVKSQANIQEAQENNRLPFQIKSFTNRADAIDWLT